MKFRYTFAILFLVLSLAPKASAIVITSGNLSDFLSTQTGVGTSNVASSLCSGSLLTSGLHFLTAAHCVLDSNTGLLGVSATVSFTNTLGTTFNYSSGAIVANQTFANTYDSINKTWAFTSGFDLAIIALTEIVDTSINRLSLYTGSGELGSVGTVIGYGRSGFGATGSVQGTFGTRREGENEIDLISNGRILYYDFDNGLAAQNVIVGSSLGRGAREVGIAPGDSGGPTLIGGQIAGIHSFIACSGAGITTCFSPPDIDTTLNSSFGERFADTRVSSHITWINTTVSDTTIPEPATYATGLLGLIICLAKARKTRTGSPS